MFVPKKYKTRADDLMLELWGHDTPRRAPEHRPAMQKQPHEPWDTSQSRGHRRSAGVGVRGGETPWSHGHCVGGERQGRPPGLMGTALGRGVGQTTQSHGHCTRGKGCGDHLVSWAPHWGKGWGRPPGLMGTAPGRGAGQTTWSHGHR